MADLAPICDTLQSPSLLSDLQQIPSVLLYSFQVPVLLKGHLLALRNASFLFSSENFGRKSSARKISTSAIVDFSAELIFGFWCLV